MSSQVFFLENVPVDISVSKLGWMCNGYKMSHKFKRKYDDELINDSMIWWQGRIRGPKNTKEKMHNMRLMDKFVRCMFTYVKLQGRPPWIGDGFGKQGIYMHKCDDCDWWWITSIS